MFNLQYIYFPILRKFYKHICKFFCTLFTNTLISPLIKSHVFYIHGRTQSHGIHKYVVSFAPAW